MGCGSFLIESNEYIIPESIPTSRAKTFLILKGSLKNINPVTDTISLFNAPSILYDVELRTFIDHAVLKDVKYAVMPEKSTEMTSLGVIVGNSTGSNMIENASRIGIEIKLVKNTDSNLVAPFVTMTFLRYIAYIDVEITLASIQRYPISSTLSTTFAKNEVEIMTIKLINPTTVRGLEKKYISITAINIIEKFL